MKTLYSKALSSIVVLILGFTGVLKAQIPIDCSKFYLHDVGGTITGCDPITLATTVNAISTPAAGNGLAVSNNLNSGFPAVTFYTTVNNQYHYYNGSVWVNTGHNCTNAAAVNICGAGPYIYNLVGGTGQVYRYNGSGTDVLVLTMTNFDGPYDLIGDDNGNFYVLYTNAGFQKLAKYSPAGALLCTYTLVNMPNSSSGGGYAIVGNKLFVSGGAGNFVGTIAGTVITFTPLAGLPGTIGDFGSCPFPQLSSGISNPTNLTCTTLSTILTATSTVSGPSYSWSGPGIVSGSGTSAVTINQPGLYTVVITGSGGACPGASTSTINVTQNGVPPPASASSSGAVTCVNSAVNLSASPAGMNYVWTAPPGSSITSGVNSQNAVGSGGGTYTVTVTNPIGGCSASNVVTVAGNTTPPTVSATGGGILTCSTPNLTLSGSSGSSVNYNWTGPGIVSGGSTANPVVNQPGSYNLTVTNPSNGCTASAAVNVTQNITPPSASAAAASGSVLNCNITSLSLSGGPSSGVNYSWSGPGIISGGSSANPVVNQPGVYTLIVTNTSNGCSNSGSPASVSISQNVVNISGSASTTSNITCLTNAVNLSSSPAGYSYAWVAPSGSTVNSGANAQNATATGGGTYSVTISDPSSGCFSNATISIPQNTTPPAGVSAAAAGTITCTTPVISLTGSPSSGVTYSWSGPGIVSGATTANPSVNQPGNYNLTVTNTSNGCSNATPVTVNVVQNGAVPPANASVTGSITCTVNSLTLTGTASSGATYNWTGPGIVSGGTTINPVVNMPGSYVFNVTNGGSGCTNASTVIVTLNTNLPTPGAVAAAGNNTLTCTSPVLTLNSTPTSGVTYSWAGPGIVSGGTTANPTVNLPGTYSLTVTSTVNGCVSNTPAVLSISQNTTVPTINLTAVGGNGTITCVVNPVVLNATPASGVSYNWSGPGIVSGANTANPSVNQAGNYSVTVTDNANGCSNTSGSLSSVINVPVDTLHPVSQINVATTGSITCTNTVVVINGSASTTGSSITYSWTTTTGVISGNGTTAMPSVTGPGSYTLTVLNTINGCKDTSIVNVSINVALPAGVDAGSSALLPCDLGNISLNSVSTTTNVLYTWVGPGNYTSSSQTATGVNAPGVYTLTVTDNVTGCESTDTVSVIDQSVNAAFTADQTDGVMPFPVSFTNNSTGAGTYNWAFGDGNTSTATDTSNTYLNAGTYHVVLIVYNNAGTCSDTATTVITVRPDFTLIIPNVFTPNNDGVNDEFYIKNTGVKELTCDIFNRWGEKMFTLTSPHQKWDGITSAGDKATDGTYLYILKVVPFNGETVEKQGSINLFR